MTVDIEPSAIVGLCCFAAFGASFYLIFREARRSDRFASFGSAEFAAHLAGMGALILADDELRLTFRPHYLADAFFAAFGLPALAMLLFQRNHDALLAASFFVLSTMIIAGLRSSAAQLIIRTGDARFEVYFSTRFFWIRRSTVRLSGRSLTFAPGRIDGNQPDSHWLTLNNERGESLAATLPARLPWRPALSPIALSRLADVVREWCANASRSPA